MNLFAERSWFATTMCSLSDGVIATDASGFVRFINPSAERLTGWAKADAIGKSIEELYSLCTFAGKDLAECQIQTPLLPSRDLLRRPVQDQFTGDDPTLPAQGQNT